MGVISIRTIAKVQYISSELQYEYMTNSHILFMLIIALPILAKLILIIPIVLFRQL